MGLLSRDWEIVGFCDSRLPSRPPNDALDFGDFTAIARRIQCMRLGNGSGEAEKWAIWWRVASGVVLGDVLRRGAAWGGELPAPAGAAPAVAGAKLRFGDVAPLRCQKMVTSEEMRFRACPPALPWQLPGRGFASAMSLRSIVGII